MRINNTNIKLNFSCLENFRRLILALVTVIPMACAPGPMAEKQVRNVGPFKKIEVGGLVNVKIIRGDQQSVTVRAYGIEMRNIITKIKGETLLVKTQGSHRGESISIDVTYRELHGLKTSGAATIKTEGVLTAVALDIETTDAGDADLVLDVDRLNIDMSGNGNLKLSGRAVTQRLVSRGGGGSLNNAGLTIINDD